MRKFQKVSLRKFLESFSIAEKISLIHSAFEKVSRKFLEKVSRNISRNISGLEIISRNYLTLYNTIIMDY